MNTGKGEGTTLLLKANKAFEDSLKYILESTMSNPDKTQIHSEEEERNYARTFCLACKDLETYLLDQAATTSAKAQKETKAPTKADVQEKIKKLEKELTEKMELIEKYKKKMKEWTEELAS